MPFHSRTVFLLWFTVAGKNETCLGFNVKCPIILPDSKFGFPRYIFIKVSSIKCRWNPCMEPCWYMRKDGRTNTQTGKQTEKRKCGRLQELFATTQTRVKNECVEGRSHGRALWKQTIKGFPWQEGKNHERQVERKKQSTGGMNKMKKRKDRHTQKKKKEVSLAWLQPNVLYSVPPINSEGEHVLAENTARDDVTDR